MRKLNRHSAEGCGFESEKSAIGKSPTAIATKDSANFLMSVDRAVMSENKIKIIDEKLIRNDGEINQYLTIKSPWYNDQNKITGIFGCSIHIGVQPFLNHYH